MAEEKKTVLTMRHLSMTFPGLKALDNVDFTLRSGEVQIDDTDESSDHISD